MHNVLLRPEFTTALKKVHRTMGTPADERATSRFGYWSYTDLLVGLDNPKALKELDSSNWWISISDSHTTGLDREWACGIPTLKRYIGMQFRPMGSAEATARWRCKCDASGNWRLKQKEQTTVRR